MPFRTFHGAAVKKRKVEIAPSILAADFRYLEREVKAAQDGGADWIHCDIMDGVFVPNISFGPMVVEAVKKCITIPLDVHLMIAAPQKYIMQFCDAGADNLTVHADAVESLPDVFDAIRARGVNVGVTVNPDKPISLFEHYLDRVDLVLIMSVYAGFGGQKFMPEVLEKVSALTDRRRLGDLAFSIEIDGGINAETAARCIDAGVDILVSGSCIFGSSNYRSTIEHLRNAGKDRLS
ncbi:MAG: ribulose-phosphate 3-epimerase [Chitinispirillaceae bacterium]|nr:ribulose-phosphate 3-epimerase [Chitinispirillaceae bacterium]